MAKIELELPEHLRAVGVVKRREAPLVERLLAERESPRYQVALDEPSGGGWPISLAGAPLIVSLFGLLEAIRFTR